MKTLTLDIGNSRVKAIAWENGEVIDYKISEELNFHEIKELIIRNGLKEGIISSVRGKQESVESNLRSLISHLYIFDSQNLSDFYKKSDYCIPIGADRAAAFYGAEFLFPSTAKIIVDSGTAMTLDVVDTNGFHKGGDISLGLWGRTESLYRKTAQLPEIKINDFGLPEFGKETVSAIVNGAIRGIVGEILYGLRRAERLYKARKVLITGGDGEPLANLLKEEGCDVTYDPFLVSRGLDVYLRSKKVS